MMKGFFFLEDVQQLTVFCKVCRATAGLTGGKTANPFNQAELKHPKEHVESLPNLTQTQ